MGNRRTEVIVLCVIIIVAVVIFCFKIQPFLKAYQEIAANNASVANMNAKALPTSTPPAAAASSSAAPAGIILVPTSSVTMTGSSSVLFAIESANVTSSAITSDPALQNKLSLSRIMKIKVLAPFPFPYITSGTIITPEGLQGQEFYVLAGASYMNMSAVGYTGEAYLTNCDIDPALPSFPCLGAMNMPQEFFINTPALLTFNGENGAQVTIPRVVMDQFSQQPGFPTSTILIFWYEALPGYGEFCPLSLIDYGLREVTDYGFFPPFPITTGDPSVCFSPGTNTTSSGQIFFGLEPVSSTSPLPTIAAFNSAGNEEDAFTVSTSVTPGLLQMKAVPIQD